MHGLSEGANTEIDNASFPMVGTYKGLGDRQAYFLLYILLCCLNFKQVSVFLSQKQNKIEKLLNLP